MSDAKAISQIRQRLERVYKGSTELFPDLVGIKQIQVIPTQSTIINAITGIGGFPRGRMTEVYGPFSSGKTTIATEAVVAGQQLNGEAALYVDFEHAFDLAYGLKLGLNMSEDKFIFTQPEYFEQGADIVMEFVNADLVDMVVIDSAAAMIPKKELEGKLDHDGGTQKGLQAALMAQFLSKLTKRANKGRKPAIVLINQTRANIQIGGRPAPNAPKEKSAAGNAILFYSSLRMRLDPLGDEGDELRGKSGGRDGTDQLYTRKKVRVIVEKNKLAPPFMRGIIQIEFGLGTNDLVSVAELAEAKLGIMSGAGFIKYKGDTPETSFSCRGREAFQDILKTDPEIRAEITEKVKEAIRNEHAKAMGLENLKVTGRAKEIESLDSDEDQEDEEDQESNHTETPMPVREE